MRRYQTGILTIDKYTIPYKLIFEKRRNVTASIRKQNAVLRLPSALSKQQFQEYWKWFEDWLTAQIKDNPILQTRFTLKEYHQQQIRVGAKSYFIQVQLEDRKTNAAKLKDASTISIKLNAALSKFEQTTTIKQLISRVVSKDQIPWVQERVNYWNHLHFGKEIKEVRLKYNSSNWGSCSSRGQINLSSRLLFAPAEVVDYVIIHELAHLVEANHSERFWAIVSDIMPDYRRKEEWLKRNDHRCDF